jgi:DNA repair exonuclease SbcCD ATPase subunit
MAMNIKLHKISINSFKGIKSFAADFNGNGCTIIGENGTGKTSVYDSFLWLLFSKDSSGRKDFEMRPLNSAGEPVGGLTLTVEADLEIDGARHVFRKEHKEKVVKKELRGFETLCWIDEVPKKVGEFADHVAGIISEDTFKMLTDLTYFNAKLHWTDRRKVLMAIAGEVGTPEGFEKLAADLNDRSVEDYKAVIAAQKKRLVKERDEIDPRIDELQRGLIEYATDIDVSDLEVRRTEIKKLITNIDETRDQILGQEKDRQARIDAVNELKSKRIDREAELKSDTSGVQSVLDKKARIEKGIAAIKQNIADHESMLSRTQQDIKNDESEMASSQARLTTIRDEYNKANEAPLDGTCYACGQKLPQDKLKEAEDKRQASLKEIAKRGNDIKADVETCKKSIEATQAKIKEMSEPLEKERIKLKDAIEYRDAQLPKLDAILAQNKPAEPSTDDLWQQITADIEKAQAEIGEPGSVQLEKIESERSDTDEKLVEINKALAQQDRIKQDAARIKELEEDEKRISQQIADCDAALESIDQYNAARSRMVEEAVNGKFKHVSFKLFDVRLNGSIEECCVATFNGVPFGDMSTGQKIFCGIDILNILTKHYNTEVPLFVDHSESLTYPIEFEGQTIQLCAVDGVKKVEVTKIETRKAVA